MIIIKIGGGADINIKGIAKDLAVIDDSFVIVHGANSIRDQLAEQLNTPKKVITSASGYSSVFSDESAIDLMMMAYAGLRNKRIVESFHQHGINAIGLSGLDGKLIQGQRNRGIRVREGDKLMIVRDFSGKPSAINSGLLNLLLNNGYTPVLSVPIIDEQNCAVNTENDEIINVLQESIGAETIIQLIEAPGFLGDANDPSSIIPVLDKQDLEQWEHQVTGRMKRKILALRKLFNSGSPRVIIADGRVDSPVKSALDGKGTVIQ
jgi:acetylglutamate/LysW-gamma-L-alpha-aminoadipate kinase